MNIHLPPSRLLAHHCSDIVDVVVTSCAWMDGCCVMVELGLKEGICLSTLSFAFSPHCCFSAGGQSPNAFQLLWLLDLTQLRAQSPRLATL